MSLKLTALLGLGATLLLSGCGESSEDKQVSSVQEDRMDANTSAAPDPNLSVITEDDEYLNSQYSDDDSVVDDGYSGGEVLAGMAVGALAGYAASKMLSNGMKEVTDSKGKTYYQDKNGSPISKQSYDDYRKVNPTVTTFKEQKNTNSAISNTTDIKAKTVASPAPVKAAPLKVAAPKSNFNSQKSYSKSVTKYPKVKAVKRSVKRSKRSSKKRR